MRRLAPLALLALLTSCGEAPPAASPAATAGPIAVVRLPVGTGQDGGAPEAVSIPAGSAQVQIRLRGIDQPAVELTAELESRATGEVRRWPVDEATAGTDGATLAVTVPVYALPAGDHVLTLWAGDADLLRRYAFRVVVS